MTTFLNRLKERFRLPGEYTIEVNPGQVNRQSLNIMRQHGCSRLSIGAQSFHQQELDFLQRPYPVSAIHQTIRDARAAGFDNISLDLIFALPGLSLPDWEATLKTAIATEAQHISAYSLTYEKDTPLHIQLQSGRIMPIEEETDREMYELAIDILSQAGYEQYEISNFSRPGFLCRHNLSYWGNESYIGIGPAAASWWQGHRSSNIADIREYLADVTCDRLPIAESRCPTSEEIACETAVLMLRRIAGINLEEYRRKTGFDFLSLFPRTIESLCCQNLLEKHNNSIRLSRNVLPVADRVVCEFADL